MTTPLATDDLRELLGVGPRRDLPLALGRALWTTNVAVLAALVAWIFIDGRFPEAALEVAAKFHRMLGGFSIVVGEGRQPGLRLVLLWSLIVVAVVTALGIFMTLFAGASSHRRLRSWLLFTMLVAAWLTLLMAWPEFAWQGQRLRMRANLGKFDAIASSLRDDWPTADGEREGLGTFMAYPQGKPRMLMMLKSETNPAVSAVERADDGTLGFELRGDPSGAWLEWHPDGSSPRAFVGGLEGQYDFRRAAPLGRGWYLVRYH